VLLGLTTDQKLGLAGTAVVFIVFALVCALLIPRYRPDFPGRRGLGLFIVLTVLLTIAMLGAVEVWAVEEEEPHAAETHQTETGEEPPPPPAEPPPPGPPPPEEPAGDPQAGEEVFASTGCGSCHAFEAAGTTGTVGPNLDDSLEGKDAAYVRTAIVEPNAEVAEGYPEGVMPGNYGDQLSEEQLNDLVAFLTS
jgi:mono/diheme cytochrome c family protein